MIALDHTFDSEFANNIARLESYNKHLYRPNTYLHKWWARRCGTTFRLILKQLAENVQDREFYSAGGLEGVVVLDPMMGGGTTVHEAIRLGANVIGIDVDPIPILQARASLSRVSSRKLEEPFHGLLEAIGREIEPLLEVACPTCQSQSELRFILHGLRRLCECGPAIHIDSFMLRNDGQGEVVRLCPICHRVHKGEHCPNPAAGATLPPIYEKTTKKCPLCDGRFKEETGKPFYLRYVALVSVGTCVEHGLFFKGLDPLDLELIRSANDRRDDLVFSEGFAIVPGPKSNDLLRRHIKSYKELFSSRQLIYLHAAINYLGQLDPEFRLPLGLLASTSLEFNSMLCGYKGADKRRAGAIRHAFSHHAYSFPYTALENNPLFPTRASGTLRKLFYDRVILAKKWAAQPRERNISGGGPKFRVIQHEMDRGFEVNDPAELAEGSRQYYLRQASSTALDLADDSVDFVVTDPPYYDSVEYGDLSAFFRVWLRPLLGNSAGDNIVWDYNIPHFGGKKNVAGQRFAAYEHYLQLMTGIFAECYRVMRKDQARLVFTFHHWKADSWAALTISLSRAGFRLVNRYVVHSENPVSVHIKKLRALTDDAILVLAPEADKHVKAWERPATISFQSSAEFCADCGSMVGWLLESGLQEYKIRAAWHELLAQK